MDVKQFVIRRIVGRLTQADPPNSWGRRENSMKRLLLLAGVFALTTALYAFACASQWSAGQQQAKASVLLVYLDVGTADTLTASTPTTHFTMLAMASPPDPTNGSTAMFTATIPAQKSALTASAIAPSALTEAMSMATAVEPTYLASAARYARVGVQLASSSLGLPSAVPRAGFQQVIHRASAVVC